MRSQQFAVFLIFFRVTRGGGSYAFGLFFGTSVKVGKMTFEVPPGWIEEQADHAHATFTQPASTNLLQIKTQETWDSNDAALRDALHKMADGALAGREAKIIELPGRA